MLLLNNSFPLRILVCSFLCNFSMYLRTKGHQKQGGCGAAVPRNDHMGVVGAAAVLMKLEMHSNNECEG